MIDKKIYIVVSLFILLSSYGICAEKNIINRQSDEPMEVTSNRMEAFNEKKLIVFSGNAKVIKGNNVMKSDRLLLYYKDKTDDKEKKITINTGESGDLDRIEAKGNVSFIQGDRIATGDDAVYFRESNKIVLTGNALLNEGKNSIKGDRVTVLLNENRGIVESDTKGQVKAIIYPQSRKKTEKK